MDTLINKYCFPWLLSAVIQQLIVGSSTFFMIQLGLDLGDRMALVWLLGFVFSLVFVFVPRIFNERFLVKAKYRAFEKHVGLYEENLFACPYLRTDRAYNSGHQAFFQNQTWLVINEAYDFLDDFVSLVLNVVINIAVISSALTSQFLLAYLVAVFIIVISIKFSGKTIAHKSAVSQEKQGRVQSIMFPGWDTILVGNKYNWWLWKKEFNKSVEGARNAEIGFRLASNLLSLGIIAVSIIPITIVIMRILFSEPHDAGFLTAIVVTLPRHVNNIQHLSLVIEDLAAFLGIREKVRMLVKASSKIEDASRFQGDIDWSRLTFILGQEELQFDSFDDCISFINRCIGSTVGNHMLVIGGNGAGKTTLLMKIKEFFGDDAFFYSNHLDLYFADSSSNDYSTGQRVRADMNELMEARLQRQVRLFLLDEWNANLDDQNQARIQEEIDKLAADSFVIEVRNKDIPLS